MSLQSVRGTHDLLPEAQAKHNMILDRARILCERFGYQEMSTPIFEFSEVFKRTLGEASDIVSKEMYTFKDRNGEELTLRPEGTAGVARSFISEGLAQKIPLKLFYQGPMFRYERPQKGRQRQFHQLGVEILGVPSAYADLEALTLAYEFLKELQVMEHSVLEINSIGDSESRSIYVERLVQYLTDHKTSLSEESQRRLQENPLRVLDSKSEADQALLKNAPQIAESYNAVSKEFFETITGQLKDLNIPFHINPFLVRGLDYYTHCVFEFKTSALGAQDAILSGGRYDHLIRQMGGPATPGFGWAAGIERLCMLSPLTPKSSRPLAIIPVHATSERQAFQLCYELRAKGFTCEMAFSGNLSKRMKRATSQNCRAAIIVGPDEWARGEVNLKIFESGEQKTIQLGLIQSELETYLKV